MLEGSPYTRAEDLFRGVNRVPWSLPNHTWQRPRELPTATPSTQPSELPASELSRSTPELVSWIDVGLFPNPVAVGEQGVWVSVPGNDGTFGGEMVRLASDRARSSNESRFPPSRDGKWEEAASRPAQEASGWLARPISMPQGR